MHMRHIALAAITFIAFGTAGAIAQTFPSKAGRIVVGFAPGGNTDLVARITAQKLGELWGQTVITDNRPGASGMIAGEIVAKAAPDGYTLLLTPQTSIAVAPALYGKAPYDPAKDFTPITLAGSSPLLMVVHPSFPAKTLAEFMALAKKSKANSLTFGSGGIGSSPHMAGELLAAALGIKMNHVPYKGENPALTDTVGIVGASGERVEAVLARPRNLPDCTKGTATGRLPNMIGIWPPTVSVSAGFSPL